MEGRGYIHRNKSATSGPNADFFEAHNTVAIAFTEWNGLPPCLRKPHTNPFTELFEANLHFNTSIFLKRAFNNITPT
jgi:hypothetical protein